MDAMLANLSPDPRVHLKAGFRDAGEATFNLESRGDASKDRTAFFDPHAPGGLPMPTERVPEEEEVEEDEADEAAEDEEDAAPPARRSGILKLCELGSRICRRRSVSKAIFHGFNTYNVEDPLKPQLLGSVVCPGGQGDVSIVGNLLIMSVEQTRGRLDCGLQGVAEPVSASRFRGVRIFDISDVRMPKQVAAVQTCRGSHTHTVVTDPDDEGNIYVFGSGTSSVRSGEELAECSDADPGEDANTALFSIDVIQIPIARPEEARIVNRPRIFADPDTGAVAGLWEGRQTWARDAEDERDQPVPRHHRVYGNRSRRRSVFRKRHPSRYF